MSFVADAVKKVFRGIKKVAKKIWDNPWTRTAVLVGASVFVAGLASGGWSYKSGGGVGKFFESVGQTFSKGWNQITNGVKGWFQGANGTTQTGNSLIDAMDEEALDRATDMAIETGGESLKKGIAEEVTDSLIDSTVTQKSTGGGGAISKFWGWISGESKSAEFVRNAAMAGFKSHAEKERYEEAKWYRNNATIHGGPAFGGQAEPTRAPLNFSGQAPQMAFAAPAAQQDPTTFAAQQNRAQGATPMAQGQPQGSQGIATPIQGNPNINRYG